MAHEDPVLLAVSLEQMRVFLSSDPQLYDIHEMKKKAEELQYLGEFLLEEFEYKNEARIGFYIKRTKESFRTPQGRFPFKNCSGHHAQCTDGYGPQKLYYSSKNKALRLAMDVYYIGPKKKSEAPTSAFSLLAIVPARSKKKNEVLEQQSFLPDQTVNNTYDEAPYQPESFVNPRTDSFFDPSPVQSDANFEEVDIDMYLVDY